MKTLLDQCKTLFLDELFYRESLQIMVSENVKPMGSEEKNRCFKIEFQLSDMINFQVIHESFTVFDENEVLDTEGFIQVVSKSQYMKFVETHHGFYEDILEEKAKLYRIWTEDEVIDVVSLKEPRIEEKIDI